MATAKIGLLGAILSRVNGSWVADNEEDRTIADLANVYLESVIYVPTTTLHEMYNTGGDPHPDNTATQILIQDLGATLVSLASELPFDPEVLY